MFIQFREVLWTFSESKIPSSSSHFIDHLTKHVSTQADMESHQNDVKLCTELHADLARELGDISAGIADVLNDTAIPIADRVGTLYFLVSCGCCRKL